MADQNNKDVVDLGKALRLLWAKKKIFFIMWPIVAALSILWIIPQPRFYTSSVSLAPEAAGENANGGLAGIASSFGINIGGASSDAIYPELYPDLMESNEFVFDLLSIKIKTIDDSIHTDYYTYMKQYQKKNWLTAPFKKLAKSILPKEEDPVGSGAGDGKLNPFQLSKKNFELFEIIKDNIKASVDKKTGVVTIDVKDQDPLVSATMADSVRARLQLFITDYRTKKARLDVDHYQSLVDSALIVYKKSVAAYSAFCDANQDVMLQVAISDRDQLESDMQLNYNTYTAMKTQLELAKAKLQERTPSFTTLKSATVPIKPAGPKRMIFVAMMLILSTFVAAFWIARHELHFTF